MKMNIKKLIVVLALGVVSAFAFTGCDAKDFLEEKINQARCEHEFGDVVTVEDSTCMKAGYGEKTCPKCKKVEKVDFEKTKHTTIVVEGVDATCNTLGLTSGTKCKVCDVVITAQATLPALGHVVAIDKGVEAGCLTSGLTQGEHCSTCNEILLAQTVIPAKGHNVIVTEAKEPTCTLPGKTQGASCKTCGEVYQVSESVPAKGHKDDNADGYCDTCNLFSLDTCIENGRLILFNSEDSSFPSVGLALGRVFFLETDSPAELRISAGTYHGDGTPLYLYFWVVSGELKVGMKSGVESSELTRYVENICEFKTADTGVYLFFKEGHITCYYDSPFNTPFNFEVSETSTYDGATYGFGIILPDEPET